APFRVVGFGAGITLPLLINSVVTLAFGPIAGLVCRLYAYKFVLPVGSSFAPARTFLISARASFAAAVGKATRAQTASVAIWRTPTPNNQERASTKICVPWALPAAEIERATLLPKRRERAVGLRTMRLTAAEACMIPPS